MRKASMRPRKATAQAVAPEFISIDGKLAIPDVHGAANKLWHAQLDATFGNVSTLERGLLFDQLVSACTVTDVSDINRRLAMLAGLRPKGTLQTMLAVQLVALHDFAMRELAGERIDRASELLRQFSIQAAALRLSRTKKIDA